MSLHLAIAGIGSRFLAVAVDTLIQIFVVLVALMFLTSLAMTRGLSGESRNWVIAAYGFGGFLLFYGYYAFFEIIWNGQTPGKRYVGIRVMKDSGRPLTAGEHIGRNLMRIIDQIPFFYAVGVLTALLNSQHKRLGDLLVGAILVREDSLADLKPLSYAPEVATGVMLNSSGLTADDLALIDAFLARRDHLDLAVRRTTAMQIVIRLRARMPDDVGVTGTDEAILETLSYQIRSTGRLSR